MVANLIQECSFLIADIKDFLSDFIYSDTFLLSSKFFKGKSVPHPPFYSWGKEEYFNLKWGV